MKVVEVIDGVRTEPAVIERLVRLAHAFGHAPVRARDTPGFLVNHAGRAYGTEALRLLAEGIAEFSAIDDVLREAAGFRMGPFELMDLTGLDVSQPVMDSIYHQFYEEPRFRPSPVLTQRRQGGLLGRKSGAGFYRYVEGARQAVEAPTAPGAPRDALVWVSRAETAKHAEVQALVVRLGARIDAGARPSDSAICVLTPWSFDATAAALAEGLDARRCVAIDASFGLATRRTLMTTPVTDAAVRDAAHGAFRLRRRARVGDPRQPRIHRAARGGAGRQRRLRHRPAAHRHARRHRPRRHAGPGLPAGTARHGRCAGRRAACSRSWKACSISTATRAIARAPGSRGARASACPSPPPEG